MLYPMVEIENTSRDMIDTFGGYNHNLRINDNEFFDMLNMSADAYPTLSVRKKRGKPLLPSDVDEQALDGYLTSVNGILYNSDLYFVTLKDGFVNLFKNYKIYDSIYVENLDETIECSLVSMGAYIIVLPVKVYFNTVDKKDKGKIEASFTSSESDVITIKPCDADGTVYEIDGVYDTMPENYWEGYVWLDINKSPATLKKYSAGNQMWSSVATNYIRVTCKDIGKNFKSGDGIDISGFINDDTAKLNGNNVVKNVVDNDNIVIVGLLDTVQSKYTMQVNMATEINDANDFIEVLYDGDIGENELEGKQLVVGEKVIDCIGNTTPTRTQIIRAELEEEGIWLDKNRANLFVGRDAVNSNIVYIKINDDTDINFEHLVPGSYVQFGINGMCSEIISDGYDGGAYSRYLLLKHPVTVKEDDAIYPAISFTADNLYSINIKTNTYGTYNKNDGVSLTLEEAWKQTAPITLKREMPDVDFVIESKNRLWGCRYGKDKSDSFVNEIYASKLGDFKNWSCYEGISTDSYRASLGTDGEFTGAICFQGYPMFFKENYLHIVYGNYPAQYQINDSSLSGVEKGSEKSLAIINDALYYKSKSGIMAYTGSYPSEVSYILGDKLYKNAIACAHKGKYYVEMLDKETNKQNFFIFDTKRGLWHKEDSVNAIQLCSKDDDVYCLNKDKKIIALLGGASFEKDVEWYAETGNIGLFYVDKKYITRISIRLSMELGANVDVYIQYDSNGEWIRKMSIVSNKLKTTTLPIRPQRCDHFKIRIEGRGKVNIYSISKTLEQGSDL